MNAHTHAALKDTGPELAAAIQSVGLSAWPGVLKDAQDRVTQLLSPAVRADFVPAESALAGAARPSYPRLDGSGDRIRPVYPVETAIAAAVAALTGGASAAARVFGGAALRQVLGGRAVTDGAGVPAKPGADDAVGRPSSGELPANSAKAPEKSPEPDAEVPGKLVDRTPSEEIDEAIRNALISTNEGTQFEGETAQLIKDAGIDVIAFQKKFWRDPPTDGIFSEIDVETPQALIEATISRSRKLTKIKDLITDNLLNPTGKPVILYAKSKYNWRATQDVIQAGGLVARTPDELINLLRTLGSR
jgi:hypothetical protein